MSEAYSCVANDEEHVEKASDNFILPDVMTKAEKVNERETVSGNVKVKEEPVYEETSDLTHQSHSDEAVTKAEKVNERETVSGNVKVKEEPVYEETSDLTHQSHSDEAVESSGEMTPPERKKSKKNERVQRDSLDKLLTKFKNKKHTMEILIIPSSEQSIFEEEIVVDKKNPLGKLKHYFVISSLLEQDKKFCKSDSSAHITFVVSAAEYDGPCTHNKKEIVQVPPRNWKSVPLSAVSGDVERTSNFTPKPSLRNKSPMDLFKMVWDDTLMQNICLYSNAFAAEKGVNLNLTVDELYKYFGIVFLSGYKFSPPIDTYQDPLADMVCVSMSMPIRRREIICKHLQFNDYCNVDASDKLYSIRPVVDQLNAKFPDLLENKGDLFSLENLTEEYEQRYEWNLQDFNVSTIGYKFWCLNTSEGYLLNFSVCCTETESPESIYSVLPAGCNLHVGCRTMSLELLEKISALNINCFGKMHESSLTNLCINTEEEYSVCRDKDITLLGKKEDERHIFATNVDKPEMSCYTMCTRIEYNAITRVMEERDPYKYPILEQFFDEGFGTKKFEEERGRFSQGIRLNPLVRFCLHSSMINVWLLHRALQPSGTLMNFLRHASFALCGQEPPYMPIR